jgi:transposase
MNTEPAPLPDDIDALKALIVTQQALLSERAVEIEHLNLIIAKLKRLQFGRRSEKLDREIEQLELRLEELQVSAVPPVPQRVEKSPAQTPVRRPLPEHLLRTRVEHMPACACPDCGTAMRRIGEDVAEMLEYVPERFRVIQHVRPKLACPQCERIVQMQAPARPIARGLAGPGLLAHVLVAKYCDHCMPRTRDPP